MNESLHTSPAFFPVKTSLTDSLRFLSQSHFPLYCTLQTVTSSPEDLHTPKIQTTDNCHHALHHIHRRCPPLRHCLGLRPGNNNAVNNQGSQCYLRPPQSGYPYHRRPLILGKSTITLSFQRENIKLTPPPLDLRSPRQSLLSSHRIRLQSPNQHHLRSQRAQPALRHRRCGRRLRLVGHSHLAVSGLGYCGWYGGRCAFCVQGGCPGACECAGRLEHDDKLDGCKELGYNEADVDEHEHEHEHEYGRGGEPAYWCYYGGWGCCCGRAGYGCDVVEAAKQPRLGSGLSAWLLPDSVMRNSSGG